MLYSSRDCRHGLTARCLRPMVLVQHARANPRRAIFVKNRRRCRIAVSDRTAARGSPAPSPPEAERAASSPKSAYGTNRQCQHFSGLLAGSAKKLGWWSGLPQSGARCPRLWTRTQGCKDCVSPCSTAVRRPHGPKARSLIPDEPIHPCTGVRNATLTRRAETPQVALFMSGAVPSD